MRSYDARGWINIDGSWNARLAKYPILRRVAHSLHLVPLDKADVPWSSRVFIHDVRKPLPFPSDSAEAIYSSHLLEHLYFEQGKTLVRECFRVLASRGILRVVVPDLASIVEEYLGRQEIGEPSGGNESLTPADRFNQRLLMWLAVPPSGNLMYRWYTTVADFHQHKWMYDENFSRRFCEQPVLPTLNGCRCIQAESLASNILSSPVALPTVKASASRELNHNHQTAQHISEQQPTVSARVTSISVMAVDAVMFWRCK